MRYKYLILAAIMICVTALGMSQTNAHSAPRDSVKQFVDWHWRRLTLEADFPKPFSKVIVVVKQSTGNYAPKITGIEISFNGRNLSFKNTLLKNLDVASDPQIGYNTQEGKIISIYVITTVRFKC